MIYYSMSITIYSRIAADTPESFAERLNNAPDQHAGVRFAVYGCGEGALHIAAAINAMRGDPKGHTHAVFKCICGVLNTELKQLRLKERTEITAREFRTLIKNAASENLCPEAKAKQILSKTAMIDANIKEYVEPELFGTDEEIKENLEVLAKEFNLDISVREEIHRILTSLKKPPMFEGPLQHYRIRTESLGDGHFAVRFLIQALYAQQLLLSRRSLIIGVYRIGREISETRLKMMLRDLRGGTCVLIATDMDLLQNPETQKQQKRILRQVLREYQKDVLFVVMEQNTVSAQKWIPENMPFLSLRVKDPVQDGKDGKAAGTGEDRKTGEDGKAGKRERGAAETKSRQAAESSGKNPGTKDPKTMDPKADARSAAEQLDHLVGLTSVKELISDLTAAAHIRELRRKAGLPEISSSMHMVFTGNPGTAKTTVARLIAQLLHENDLLPTEKMVECGRSQLVGEYVGWTAVQVRERFEEARGGVLLIDEAYALANDSGKFGQEAIDTIVQEMENRRNDTVVIFTGYPEPMEAFLEKNEGLRSRIGFRLKFPDYTAEELLEILHYMAAERGYSLTPEAARSASEVFAEAAKTKNFGNGRFVRSLLEQAELAQAHRLEPLAKAGQTLSREQLSQLTGPDLQAAGKKIKEGLKQEGKAIGFKPGNN